MSEFILEMKGIVKEFPGTLALDHVDFSVRPGEIMALIGENGAGKSTLMNVLMGIHQPNEGEILLEGKTIENKTPREALDKGIGMVPQELNLVGDISIAENIFLGSHQKKNGVIDWEKTYEKAEEALKQLDVEMDPRKKVSEISAAYQQLVSIARTLIAGSHIIIFDEPTASLTLNETQHLFNNIRKLKAAGKSIIIITHHLDEVEELSDRVSIMRDGKLVKVGNTADMPIDDMIFHMAGEHVEKTAKEERKYSEEEFFAVSDFSRKKEFEDINFSVRKGEIFGVAGLVGAGRTELFSCIYGLTKRDSGSVKMEGKEIDIRSPHEAIAMGIGLVPEERRKQGMFPVIPVYENIMLPSYDKNKKGVVIDFTAVKKESDEYIKKLRIKTPSGNVPIKSLSGGNQQKVILARWMEKKVKLLILDEPTRGIDVRAKGEIYKLIREMADTGITVIVISSEIEELLTISDRMMIMFNGKVKGIITPDDTVEREDILKIALQ
ncbi:MAG: sugar ABC transporter ATP-binding protein [Christensenella sp.]|nr:sugar ABC transporter ATP-binding protein [Christensenella sp.]MEA5004505.1 sugar ABC transporter ATP-binding protein [Christensenella sp.]